jgi:hypothetical protein
MASAEATGSTIGSCGAGGGRGGDGFPSVVGTGLSGAGSDMPKAARSSASNCDVSAMLGKSVLRGPLKWDGGAGMPASLRWLGKDGGDRGVSRGCRVAGGNPIPFEGNQ